MKRALVLALMFVAFAGASYAGSVSPGLSSLMGTMKGGDEITVWIVLRDQVDVESMDRQLHALRTALPERHAEVVGELQERAASTQPSLLADLETMRLQGAVRGFTPHWLVNSVVVRTTVEEVPALAARPDVLVVEPNLVVELIQPVGEPHSKGADLRGGGIGITPGVVSVGARRVWEELGIDGTGAVVGILDTGVDGAHPALSDRWRGNFAPAAHCWFNAIGDGSTTPTDTHYHGTHVMGTITGLAVNDTIGVAPGALWIASNVINQGTGSEFDNDVIASLEFMADPDGNPFTTDDVPDVVQNSWGVNEGFPGYFDCDSRWWTAIDNCEAAGVVITWSAGNEGPGGTSLRSPADRAASPYNVFSVKSWMVAPWKSRFTCWLPMPYAEARTSYTAPVGIVIA